MKYIELMESFISEQNKNGNAFLPHQQTALEKLRSGFMYAKRVVEGEKVTCKLTKAACQRFIDDFERDDFPSNINFSFNRAVHVLEFYALCICHVKGKLTGKPIDLMDWHAFILINIFGWVRPLWLADKETGELIYSNEGEKIPVLNEDGEQEWVRRFKIAYIEVARKNAKSTLSSGIGLYMAGFDGEGGAEVYSAATTRDQARIVFDDAKQMIKSNKLLKKVFGSHKLNIHQIESGSKFEPLSADANTLDGLNIHCGIVDELHAHKTRDVWDVLETATGAREQPLIVGITTAGFILDGICMEQRDYISKILTKSVDNNDSYFGVVYTLDDGDEPFDEKNWVKANPALGIAKKWDDLRDLAQKAKEQVSARPNFLTKHMNIWVQGKCSWINMDKYNACGKYAGNKDDATWISVDMSQKIDITAAIKTKRKSDGTIHFETKFWIPEGRLETAPKRMAELYRKWSAEGWIELTNGDVIDQMQIKQDIKAWISGDNLQDIAYDPWSATQFALDLQKDGLPTVEVSMTTKNLSEAMKESEAMIYAGRVFHDHNPIMAWMMSNVMIKPDKNDNIFPLKERDENKIDGAVAWFIGMSRVILGENQPTGWAMFADDENYDDDDEICYF